MSNFEMIEREMSLDTWSECLADRRLEGAFRDIRTGRLMLDRRYRAADPRTSDLNIMGPIYIEVPPDVCDALGLIAFVAPEGLPKTAPINYTQE